MFRRSGVGPPSYVFVQLSGVTWLYRGWHNKQMGILADEMGLVCPSSLCKCHTSDWAPGQNRTSYNLHRDARSRGRLPHPRRCSQLHHFELDERIPKMGASRKGGPVQWLGRVACGHSRIRTIPPEHPSTHVPRPLGHL